MANVFEITRKLLETRFKSYWESIPPEGFGSGTPPLFFENTPERQPTDGMFLRFTILFAVGQQASLGSRPLEFQDGEVIVQVFAKKDTGTRSATKLADFVAAGLRYGQLNESGVVVSFRTPQVVPVGSRKTHYQLNVRVEFRAQHIAAVAA